MNAVNELSIYAQVKSTCEQSIARDVLLESYKLLKQTELQPPQTRKLLAEICYLLARDFLKSRELSQASDFAREAIELYKALEIENLDEAAPILHLHLPDIMHEGVVRNRLSSVLQSTKQVDA